MWAMFLWHSALYGHWVLTDFVLVLCFIARAREDTEKIDYNVKKRAERLHHIATVCTS